MKKEMNFTVAPTMIAPIAAIERVEPHLVTDCSKCEGNINIGMFFDGTNNNRDADESDLKQSNVVRLLYSYLERPATGYFRRYIPGVGTPFPEIKEKGESNLGSGFAIGCEQRVLFAVLDIFNAIHKCTHDGAALLDEAQVTALCCNSFVEWSEESEDSMALGRLGLCHGLRIPALGGDGMRVKILKDLAKRLESALVKGRPRIKECFIDVVGFSRGAAQARVFCNWLDEILIDGKLAGVIIHFRFVGLMDTVASAGFLSSVAAAATGVEGGHSGWAESRYLRIPASVQNCVHMIAAHELRKNFPLDTITVNGALPARCQEFVYPGAHSDVGGGYAPGDLGIAVDPNKFTADAHKLAQVPLNHLLECAIAAGAPMRKDIAKANRSGYDPFALSPVVQKAYEDFVVYSTLKPRAVHEWLQPYLNWRWSVCRSYTSLTHVRQAGKEDRELLLEFNAKLIADAALLDSTAKPPSIFKLLLPGQAPLAAINAARLRLLDDEARSVLAIAKTAAATNVRLHTLFDQFVHDSLAGFNHANLEHTGYWRYRRGYLGDEKRLVAENDAAPGARLATA